jgi:1-hydroxycarotenoid 3,4-desaturase
VRKGARFQYGSSVARIVESGGRVRALELTSGEHLDFDAVICNADTNALATGLFGEAVRRSVRPTPRAARSLSALTLSLHARTSGFELAHHNVFFGQDYRGEFVRIFDERRFPEHPTVYLCAQDRSQRRDGQAPARPERLFLLMNAPPIGDAPPTSSLEIEACKTRIFSTLARCGLSVDSSDSMVTTTPWDFAELFPATGGALYGPAARGWRSSFTRPAARSTLPGLYLAGGSSHPGPGLPMATISGRLAAACLKADYALT